MLEPLPCRPRPPPAPPEDQAPALCMLQGPPELGPAAASLTPPSQEPKAIFMPETKNNQCRLITNNHNERWAPTTQALRGPHARVLPPQLQDAGAAAGGEPGPDGVQDPGGHPAKGGHGVQGGTGVGGAAG